MRTPSSLLDPCGTPGQPATNLNRVLPPVMRRVFIKYAAGCGHESYGRRGKVACEAEVYRRVLRVLPTTPKYLGAFADRGTGEAWLFFESLDESVRASGVAGPIPRSPGIMLDATRSIARFNAAHERNVTSWDLSFLIRYDAECFRGCARRTGEFAATLLRRFAWLVDLCAVLIYLAFVAGLHGAEGPAAIGSITGVIQDQTGAPIPGAKVKVSATVGTAESKAAATTTDETGHFEFANLSPGEYVVSARAPGVETGEAKVKLGATPTKPIRLRLEIAEVSEEVTVTADDFATPSAQTNIDVVTFGREWLASLPSKDGDPLAVPMSFINPAAAGTGGPKILVDGVETDALDVPDSSIRHVYVNRNPYGPEFGRPGKGRIEVTTIRRVHRKYHGSVSTLFRNSALDARNAFATVRPLQQRVISEAEVDGPIAPGNRKVGFLLAARHDSNNQGSVIAAQTLAGPFVANIVAPERNTYLFGRVNLRIFPAHKLAAAYKFKDKSRENQGVRGFNLPERGINRVDQENEVKLFATSTPSATLINDVRVAWRHRNQSSIAAYDQPATIVVGAFNAGGGQVAVRQTDTVFSFEDIATVARRIHTLRFGVGVRPSFLRAQDASNFGGTFSFSSLAAFAERRPYLYTRNTGSPAVRFTQHETYAFMQDEIRVRPNFSLTPGVRYEWQSNGNSLENFAPRLAVAYSPRAKQTVLRAGFGVFYERQPEVMEQRRLLEDGVRIRKIVIPDPAFTDPFAMPALAPFAIPSVTRIAPGIGFPYLMQASFAVEQKLGGRPDYLTLEYSTIRGVNLYRTRNINAPLPGTILRPDPDFLNIDQFESNGRSRGNSLAVTFQTRSHKGLNLMAQYTLSRTTDDTSGLFSLPANNYDLGPERGRADYDQRHRLSLLGTYETFWGLHLGGTLQYSSGLPFDITTGFDDNRDTVANDRPSGIHRNTGRGPDFIQVDVRVSKVVRFENPSGLQLEMAADAFNLTNRVNFTGYVGALTSPFYGRANSAFPARQIQLSFRVRF